MRHKEFQATHVLFYYFFVPRQKLRNSQTSWVDMKQRHRIYLASYLVYQLTLYDFN